MTLTPGIRVSTAWIFEVSTNRKHLIRSKSSEKEKVEILSLQNLLYLWAQRFGIDCSKSISGNSPYEHENIAEKVGIQVKVAECQALALLFFADYLQKKCFNFKNMLCDNFKKI